MAAPNLTALTAITGKTTSYAVTDTLSALLTNSAISDVVYRIAAIRCANVTGSTAESITLTIYDGATDVHLASTISVPVNGTQVLANADAYLYLKEGWSLKAQASAATSLELVVSYEVLG